MFHSSYLPINSFIDRFVNISLDCVEKQHLQLVETFSDFNPFIDLSVIW